MSRGGCAPCRGFSSALKNPFKTDAPTAHFGGNAGAKYARPWHSARMRRWGRFVVAYALLSLFAYALCHLLGVNPWSHPEPWWVLDDSERWVYSAGLGLVLAALLIYSTRVAVKHFGWAQELHRVLRPVARGIDPLGIVLLAALSAVGEELLFRGLLTPLLGVTAQAVIFGLVHQVSGPSRWVWVVWAGVVGALLGLLFVATGSLLGPLLAHGLVNAVNLSYLKWNDLESKGAQLGGLLGQRG